MDWENRSLTPFISATASRAKAIHYATQREEWGHGNVWIATIDTAALRASRVITYHMATLVEDTGAEICDVAWNEHEYLCLHHIPDEAIVDVWTLDGEDDVGDM
jgi:hypothetical protein